MNSLSWLLYWADVCGNIGGIFHILAIAVVIAFVIWVLVAPIAGEDFGPSEWKVWRKVGYNLVPTFLIIFFVGAFVPSKNTVYAIAASEMGEKALQSPVVTKAGQALEAWLDAQINKVKAPAAAPAAQ